MNRTLAGFKKFLEDAGGPGVRPDQKDDSGSRNSVDSIDVQSMELGVDPKYMMSVPDVFSNLQMGNNKILGGLASMVFRPDLSNDKVFAFEIKDEGNKRFIRTPSGVLAKDPSKADTPRIIRIPRAYYVKMRDDQYGQMGAGGMGGGAVPPLT